MSITYFGWSEVFRCQPRRTSVGRQRLPHAVGPANATGAPPSASAQRGAHPPLIRDYGGEGRTQSPRRGSRDVLGVPRSPRLVCSPKSTFTQRCRATLHPSVSEVLHR